MIVKKVSTEELESKLSSSAPDNESKDSGFALVNVLPPDSYIQEHIPFSINIDKDHILEFARRFGREKEIIVYCASPECDAAPKVADILSSGGFVNVLDYAGGMHEWKKAGNEVQSCGK